MAINRREFLTYAGMGAGMLAINPLRHLMAQTTQNATSKGLNVLWIGADDLRCALACYGHTYIHSPNLDTFGVMFRNAHVQQAVCAASRASFLTGCRPPTTTVDYPYNCYFIDSFLPEHPSLPKYFFDHGYYTRWGGKIHHGSPYDTKALSSPGLTLKSDDPWWQAYATPENRAKAAIANQNRKAKVAAYEMADVPDEAYADGKLAAGTVLSLREAARQNKPFFLTPGFLRPHLPFCAPKKYWDMYDRGQIKPAEVPHRPLGAPPYATISAELPSYEGEWGTDKMPLTPEMAMTLRHAYFACTSFIDAQVGRILSEVDALKLWDNTIVVFWSDHGFHLGDQGAWGKHMNYEWSTHAPLMIWAPGMNGNGRASDALVEYVDMFSTLCDLTGLPRPSYLEGTSMVPLLDNPDRPWKSAVFSQYPRNKGLQGYAIRTARWRYVEWRIDAKDHPTKIVARELYDHQTDAIESRSVAQENHAVVRQLSEHLAAGWKAALPPGV